MAPAAAGAGKGKLIALVLIVVVAVAAVAAGFLLLGGGEPDGPGTGTGASTPEGSIDAYVAKSNSQDYAGMIAVTMRSFANQTEKDEWITTMESYSSTNQVEVTSMTTQTKDEMSSYEKDQAESRKADYEERYGITVEDYSLVEVTVLVTYGGDTHTSSSDVYCFKVNGQWYVGL